MTYDEKVRKILRSYRTKANICRGSIAYNIVEDQAVSQLNTLDKIDEKKLREYLWLSHGHYGLYGDDGEMQCNQLNCLLDFKRDSLDKIINRIIQVREKENIEKLSKSTSNKLRKLKWIKFNPNAVNLPKERRYVLVQIAASKTLGMPPSVAIGYLRRWSNRNNFFVVPGFGRKFEITHWCDCLGNDFYAPLWEGKQIQSTLSPKKQRNG